MPLSRTEELQKVQEFIGAHGVTVLEPFAEGQARKKWRLRGDDRARGNSKGKGRGGGKFLRP